MILEVGELEPPERITVASMLAMAAGATFIKTSTGKIPRSATPASVAAMSLAIRCFEQNTGRRVGLKVAGGVRTTAEAAHYAAIVSGVLGRDRLSPDLFRIGASSLLDALVASATVQ